MFRLGVIASLLLAPACRISLESKAVPADAAISPTCLEAPDHSDLKFMEDRIFKASCVFSGCHDGSASTDGGKLDLTSGHAFAALVNVDADVQKTPQFKLVVPNQPAQSYLLVMVGQIKPEDATPPIGDPPVKVGFMPQNSGGTPICQQKRDAIERWIMAGALDN